MEWKKVKFMQDRVGEDFDGLITSVTKFGFFVELTDLFVEGLVPLNTLDRRPVYVSREHARDYRAAVAEDLQFGAEDSRAGGPDRSGGEEDSVCGVWRKSRCGRRGKKKKRKSDCELRSDT